MLQIKRYPKIAQWNQTRVTSGAWSHISSGRCGGWWVVCWVVGGVPTGRPLGGAAALKWLVHRAPSRTRSQQLSQRSSTVVFFFFRGACSEAPEVRMVPGPSLLLALLSACSAFNLDTENVVRRTSGDPDSLFGFSMAMHRQLRPEDKTMWALNFLFCYMARQRARWRCDPDAGRV